jgi:hypothetical protein
MDHDRETGHTSEQHGPDVVREALDYARKAEELRGAAIKKLLEQRERIENDLKTLGYLPTAPNGNGSGNPKNERSKAAPAGDHPHSGKRFRDSTLAEIGRVLLAEHDVLHGRDIERLAKAGGFQARTKNFQNYVPVAFKRAGGFENIGGNRWKLNPNVPPKR